MTTPEEHIFMYLATIIRLTERTDLDSDTLLAVIRQEAELAQKELDKC